MTISLHWGPHLSTGARKKVGRAEWDTLGKVADIGRHRLTVGEECRLPKVPEYPPCFSGGSSYLILYEQPGFGAQHHRVTPSGTPSLGRQVCG